MCFLFAFLYDFSFSIIHFASESKMSMEKVYVPSKLGYTSPVIDLKEFLKSALIAENELYGFFHDKSRSNDEEDTRQSFANFSERNGHFGEASEVVISEVE
jgi:hypothetical protein